MPQSMSERFGHGKCLLLLPGIKPEFLTSSSLWPSQYIHVAILAPIMKIEGSCKILKVKTKMGFGDRKCKML
jgi:hypothetical protein